jgi:hypothetical protein
MCHQLNIHIYVNNIIHDRILDPTAAAKSVGIADWRSGARLAALGRRDLSWGAAAAALGVREEEARGSRGSW